MEKENFYELSYLLDTDFKEISEKEITDLISEKGKILEKSEKKKIKLAYPIKKKEEAFLETIIFLMKPKDVPFLKEGLEKKNQILRYLLLKKKKFPILETRKEPLEQKEKKVDLKKIEEKLEQILKT